MSNAPDANNPSDDSPLSNLRTCGGILIPELPSPGVPSLLVVLQSLGHMLNCVRIGKIAGVPRIIVAGQNGTVYFFEMPQPAAGAPAPSVRPI